jgi:hypothetical protein
MEIGAHETAKARGEIEKKAASQASRHGHGA